ncbi:hypothetical protein ACLB2K_037171 [Fragaria x ananassa]
MIMVAVLVFEGWRCKSLEEITAGIDCYCKNMVEAVADPAQGLPRLEPRSIQTSVTDAVACSPSAAPLTRRLLRCFACSAAPPAQLLLQSSCSCSLSAPLAPPARLLRGFACFSAPPAQRPGTPIAIGITEEPSSESPLFGSQRNEREAVGWMVATDRGGVVRRRRCGVVVYEACGDALWLMRWRSCNRQCQTTTSVVESDLYTLLGLG